MSKYNSLFSPLLGFFPRYKFHRMVKEHNIEYKAKGFSCWQQFVALLFYQIGRANSLNEITKWLVTCEGKLSHLGIIAPKKSSLAYANVHRPWELFQSVFFGLFKKTRLVAVHAGRKFKFKAKLYSIDATVINLCLNMYEWARFLRAKGAVKLYMRLDHDGYLPDYALITDDKHHERPVARQFPYTPGSVTVFDKAYNDFALFDYLCTIGAFFVTRLKENAAFETIMYLDNLTN